LLLFKEGRRIMKKLTKSVLIAFALMVFIIAVHIAEVRREKVNIMTEAFTGLNKIPFSTAVIFVNPLLY
jgi:hypothetical protein